VVFAEIGVLYFCAKLQALKLLTSARACRLKTSSLWFFLTCKWALGGA